MPIHGCYSSGKRGHKWGSSGKCYTGAGSRARAAKQATAIYASGYTGNKARNPLRADPTRTTPLRNKFEKELKNRFTKFANWVIKYVATNNSLGITANAPQYVFLTDTEKVQAFQRALASQMQSIILDQQAAEAGNAYWQRYVEQGYFHGAGRAFADVQKGAKDGNLPLHWYKGTRDEFLRSSFAQPVSTDKVKLLAGRVFTELKGVTDTMAVKMSRVLTDGLVTGQNPREIARTLASDITGIPIDRARMIARTEIIRAHAEGQLDSLQKLGVEAVGAMVEWSTAGDDLVCPECEDMEGETFSIDEARGQIPLHPNCRCAWIPANVGEEQAAEAAPAESSLAEPNAEAAAEPVPTEDLGEDTENSLADNYSEDQPRDDHGRFASGGGSEKPAAGKPEPIIGGIPPEILQGATPAELKEYKGLIKERNSLNKLVKAGTATPEQRTAAAVTVTRLAELRQTIRDRQGPGPRPGPGPKPPKPGPTKGGTGPKPPGTKGQPIADRIANDPELERIRLAVLAGAGTYQDVNNRATLYESQMELHTTSIENHVRVMADERQRYEAGHYTPEEWKGIVAGHDRSIEDSRQKIDKYAALLAAIKQNAGGDPIVLPKGEAIKVEFKQMGVTYNGKSPYGNYMESKGNYDEKQSPYFKGQCNRAQEFLQRVISKDIPIGGKIIANVHQEVMEKNSEMFRAHYSGGPLNNRGKDNGVHADKATSVDTVIHEMGHHIENYTTGYQDLAREFREMRIARSGTKNENMQDVFPGHNYKDYEVGNKDDFEKLWGKGSSYAYYAGKTYDHVGNKCTEIISMGIQEMYNNPRGFAEKDPEYFKFTLGIMRGRFT